eukprot:1021079-Rhodomonas_salina.1
MACVVVAAGTGWAVVHPDGSGGGRAEHQPRCARVRHGGSERARAREREADRQRGPCSISRTASVHSVDHGLQQCIPCKVCVQERALRCGDGSGGNGGVDVVRRGPSS